MHIADLVRRLVPLVHTIRALADEHAVTFIIVLYADSKKDFNQEVFLPREVVDLLSALGASFWVDMYFLGNDEESS